MLDYQQRVVIEKSVLDEKIKKLDRELKKFPTLGYDLLIRQQAVMIEYSKILEQRIALF